MWRYSYKNVNILFYLYYIPFRYYAIFRRDFEVKWLLLYGWAKTWSQVLGPTSSVVPVTFHLLPSSTGNAQFYDKRFFSPLLGFLQRLLGSKIDQIQVLQGMDLGVGWGEGSRKEIEQSPAAVVQVTRWERMTSRQVHPQAWLTLLPSCALPPSWFRTALAVAFRAGCLWWQGGTPIGGL